MDIIHGTNGSVHFNDGTKINILKWDPDSDMDGDLSINPALQRWLASAFTFTVTLRFYPYPRMMARKIHRMARMMRGFSQN